MIVTATGKNIYPAHVESLLCLDPLIDQALVLGDGQKFLTALLVPNEEALRREIKKHRLWIWRWHWKSLLNHRSIQRLYQRAIKKRLSDLAEHERVKRFVLLPQPFSQAAGHLTPKLSLCRSKIASDFASEIDRLFAMRA